MWLAWRLGYKELGSESVIALLISFDSGAVNIIINCLIVRIV